MFPILDLIGGSIPTPDNSMRLSNLLNRNGVHQWEELSQLDLSTFLGWKNAGVGTARELLVFVTTKLFAYLRGDWDGIAAHLQRPNSVEVEGKDGDPFKQSLHVAVAARSLAQHVREIALWGCTELQGATVLEGITAGLTAQVEPPQAVEEALAALSLLDSTALFGDDRSKYSIMRSWQAFVSGLEDAREMKVLRTRLGPQAKASLAELASEFGVTRQRISQIEMKLSSSLKNFASSSAGEPLARTCKRLRSELGVASPVESAGAAISRLLAADVAAKPSDSDALQVTLFDLAGPFELYEDWIVLAPQREVLEASENALRNLTAGGAIDLSAAIEALVELGIRHEHGEAWIERLGSFRLVDQSIVAWGGTQADKACAVLMVSGQPLSADAIADAMGGDFSRRTLRNYLLSDPRFVRRGKNLFGLAEWGGEEYSGIANEIEEEILRQGGEAELEELVDRISSTFGVSPTSVRAYANGARFSRTSPGVITLRRGSPGERRTKPLEATRRCFRTKQGWALKIAVTSETLRGSGAPIPSAFARLVGANPGGRAVELNGPHGRVRMAWPHNQPHVGSLKSMAEGFGASEGDALFLIVSDSDAGTYIVRYTSADEVSRISPDDTVKALAAEVGEDPTEWEDSLQLAAYVLGMAGDQVSAASVRSRFEARGEPHLASLVRGEGQGQTSETGLLEFLKG